MNIVELLIINRYRTVKYIIIDRLLPPFSGLLRLRSHPRVTQSRLPSLRVVNRSFTMPPRKRGAAESDAEPVPKRRSSRQIASATSKPQTTTSPSSPAAKPEAPSKQSTKKAVAAPKAPSPPPKKVSTKEKKSATPKTKSAAPKAKKEDGAAEPERERDETSPDPDPEQIPRHNPDVPRHEEPTYWLLKAEPESRFENGIDVRFSIDDLKARKKPEGWDGIRAYAGKSSSRHDQGLFTEQLHLIYEKQRETISEL